MSDRVRRSDIEDGHKDTIWAIVLPRFAASPDRSYCSSKVLTHPPQSRPSYTTRPSVSTVHISPLNYRKRMGNPDISALTALLRYVTSEEWIVSSGHETRSA